MSRRHRRGSAPPSSETSRASYEDRLKQLGAEIGGSSRRKRRHGATKDGASGPRGRTRRNGKARWSRKRKGLTIGGVVVLVLLLLAGAFYGYLRYRFDNLKKINVTALVPQSGNAFNVLVIGSDSREGLTESEIAAVGSSSAQVTGQRSDVVMIWHVVPSSHQLTIVSIPRDTMIQMDGQQSIYGHLNRINASFAGGADLLTTTIEDNFGIPINHVIEVNFAGFLGAVNSLGGVWMDFPYPAKDAYSGLDITHTGCQLLDGTEALETARSRHYAYEIHGQWLYDGTGDFGRITRQDAFLRALLDSAKSKLNPFTLNAFIGSLSSGIVIDNRFSLGGVIGLAEDFRDISTATPLTETLPTFSNGYVTPYGDVLFVDQPAAQQMLTSIFGTELTSPSTPPPNDALVPTPPPSVTTTTTTVPVTTTTTTTAPSGAPTTSAPPSPNAPPSFDPTPCTPS